MKKFLMGLMLTVIFNCVGCRPESQTTKYPEGTMVVMKLDRQNVCQVVSCPSIFWYRIKCPVENRSNIDISASSSLLGSNGCNNKNNPYIEMDVKEYEIEPLKENN